MGLDATKPNWTAIVVAVVAALGLVGSFINLWYTRHVNNRIKKIHNPILTFFLDERYTIKNSGQSTAFSVSVRTKNGSNVSWPNQIKGGRREADGTYSLEADDCCGGETRDIEAGDAVCILTHGSAKSETLIVTYKNYAGESFAVEKCLGDIYCN